ncbi:MAG: siroheme synthase [Hyphomicrobiales bacterium]|nr:hypothetical protein [Rickettsiales bacterium]MCP5361944.1 siroheme synthase [Hyphomicrobiales bacterium]
MFPIVLCPEKLHILLVGDGSAAEKRHALLKAAGCDVQWIKKADEASAVLDQGVDVLFVTDVPTESAAALYQAGKAVGALVNVEDQRAYCDFHVPSIVRRGDLLLSISTGGKSPRLAQRIRAQLEAEYGEEWARRLNALGIAREQWQAEGAPYKELSARTDALIEKNGWLQQKENA